MKKLRRFDGPTSPAQRDRVDPADPIDRSDGQLLALLNGGRAVPRYRLRQRLGYGGSARTLAVVDEQLRRTVAVKFVDLGDPIGAADLERERQALTRLTHPNIPPLLEAGDDHDHGLAWVVLPLIDGSPLGVPRRTPAAGAASWRRTCAFLLPIAEALRAAHEQDIVHGDVAPGNILCHPGGECLLIDWGSAVIGSAREGQRRRCTPAFAAPELLAGAPPTVASDIFGVGACLHLLLCGEPPSRTGLRLERAALPRRCRLVLAHCLAESPAERYRDMAMLIADLRALVLDQPPSVCPEGLLARLWRWSRGHPGTALVVVALLLALALLAGLVQERQRTRERLWQTVLTDRFDEPLSPADWSCVIYPQWDQAQAQSRTIGAADCPWWQQDGELRSRWTGEWNGCVALRAERLVGSDIRLRWTCTPREPARNLNAFIGEDRYRGWGIHIAGFGDRSSVTLTDGRFIPLTIVARGRLAEPIRADQRYRLQVALIGDRLRVLVDGQEVLTYVDPFHVDQHRDLFVGLETGGSRLAIDDWRIDQLQRPLREDLLRIPGRLLAAGVAQAALREYRAIDPDRLASDARAWRRIQIGHCLQLLKKGEAAEEQWQGIIADTALAVRWRSLASLYLGQHFLDRRDWSAMAALAEAGRAIPLDRRVAIQLWRQIADALDATVPRWQDGAATMVADLGDLLRHQLTWAERLGLNQRRLARWELPGSIDKRVEHIREDLLLPALQAEIDAIHPALLRVPEQSGGRLAGPARGGLPDASPRLPALPDVARPWEAPERRRLAPAWQYAYVKDHLCAVLLSNAAQPPEIREHIRRLGTVPVSQACPPLLRAQMVALLYCGLDERSPARDALQAGLTHPQTAAAPTDRHLVAAMLAGAALPPTAAVWQQALATDLHRGRSAAAADYRRALAADDSRATATYRRLPLALITWRLQRP